MSLGLYGIPSHLSPPPPPPPAVYAIHLGKRGSAVSLFNNNYSNPDAPPPTVQLGAPPPSWFVQLWRPCVWFSGEVAKVTHVILDVVSPLPHPPPPPPHPLVIWALKQHRAFASHQRRGLRGLKGQ
jgi:hypothetical protein